MQSELWQEIPEFDGAGVEQKWIEGNTGYNLRVLHWTPKMKIINKLEHL